MATKTSTKKMVLPNDFERMIPEYHKGFIIYGEHIVRYVSVSGLLENKVVLDIASGSGYGTKILASKAKKVFGVDVSADSIQYAKQNYSAKNITYKAGNGQKIPLEDNSVDVVVSFETIEHIEDYRQFMVEIKRVLKADGILVLSTPNDLEFAKGNHFHLHEFKQDELKLLTEEYFKYNKSYFQGTWIYTALLKEESISQEFRAPLDTLNAMPLEPEKYLYFFMLCSNRKITEKIDEFAVISEHWSARKLQEKDRLTQDHISNIQAQLKAAKQYVKQREKYIRELEAELNLLKDNTVYKLASRLKRKTK